MTGERPLVTCIVTSYRREKRIVGRALDSILKQTYSPLEILVIDDNRGDNAEHYSEGIMELVSGRTGITVIKTENGHGGQYARNTGIRYAKGEYIAFLDDDDEWLPKKLEKQVKLLNEHPDCGMCYTDGYRVYDDIKNAQRELIHSNYFKESLSFRELLHEDRIGSTSQAMIRRSTFDTVGGFDTDMPARQDYEMWLRISRSFPIKGISEGLYLYHRNSDEGKITHNWRKNVEAHRLIGEKYREEIKGDRSAEFNVVFHTAHYYKEGFRTEKSWKMRVICITSAFFYYLKSFIKSPSYFLRQAGYMIDSIRRKRSI